jgi:hypothetical protein
MRRFAVDSQTIVTELSAVALAAAVTPTVSAPDLLPLDALRTRHSAGY